MVKQRKRKWREKKKRKKEKVAKIQNEEGEEEKKRVYESRRRDDSQRRKTKPGASLLCFCSPSLSVYFLATLNPLFWPPFCSGDFPVHPALSC